MFPGLQGIPKQVLATLPGVHQAYINLVRTKNTQEYENHGQTKVLCISTRLFQLPASLVLARKVDDLQDGQEVGTQRA